jgi:hypothetical protein
MGDTSHPQIGSLADINRLTSRLVVDAINARLPWNRLCVGKGTMVPPHSVENAIIALQRRSYETEVEGRDTNRKSLSRASWRPTRTCRSLSNDPTIRRARVARVEPTVIGFSGQAGLNPMPPQQHVLGTPKSLNVARTCGAGELKLNGVKLSKEPEMGSGCVRIIERDNLAVCARCQAQQSLPQPTAGLSDVGKTCLTVTAATNSINAG